MSSRFSAEVVDVLLALILFLAGLGYSVSGLPANVVVGCLIWASAWLFLSHLYFIHEWTEGCPTDVKIIVWLAVTFLILVLLWNPVRAQYAKEHAPPMQPSPIQNSDKVQPSVPPSLPPVRSYMSLMEKGFQFPGQLDNRGGQFKVGQWLSFNIPMKATGPHPVELIKSYGQTYIRNDYSLDTQKAVVVQFRKSLRILQRGEPNTEMPGDETFFTAFNWEDETHKHDVTQSDLDNFRNGVKFAIVVIEIDFKDDGLLHHIRQCRILQPPARPPGIWAMCQVFTKSD